VHLAAEGIQLGQRDRIDSRVGDDVHRVTEVGADQREAERHGPGGAFHDRCARHEGTRAPRVEDHLSRDAVLHGVQVLQFQLRVDRHAVRGVDSEPNQGGVADRLDHRFMAHAVDPPPRP
jgi:hypothetical protein